MNSSLIVEETISEYKDLRRPIYIAFLDAKSAFDVVSHDSLLWNGAYSDALRWAKLCVKVES